MSTSVNMSKDIAKDMRWSEVAAKVMKQWQRMERAPSTSNPTWKVAKETEKILSRHGKGSSSSASSSPSSPSQMYFIILGATHLLSVKWDKPHLQNKIEWKKIMQEIRMLSEEVRILIIANFPPPCLINIFFSKKLSTKCLKITIIERSTWDHQRDHHILSKSFIYHPIIIPIYPIIMILSGYDLSYHDLICLTHYCKPSWLRSASLLHIPVTKLSSPHVNCSE